MIISPDIAREWLAARNVIADTLCDLSALLAKQCSEIAVAIIARLASHEPPILLEMQRGKVVGS